MSIRLRIIIIFLVILIVPFITPSSVFAKSSKSSSSGSVKDYYNKWCENKNNAPLETKVTCHLLDSISSEKTVDPRISALEASVASLIGDVEKIRSQLETIINRLDLIEPRLEALEKDYNKITVYDLSGTELGLFAGEDTPFSLVYYIDLNRILPIRAYDGKIGQQVAFYYTTENCTEAPYLYTQEYHSNRILYNINSPSEFYIVPDNQLYVDRNIKSYRTYNSLGTCFPVDWEVKVLPLKEVVLDLPDPVELPLQYRYE